MFSSLLPNNGFCFIGNGIFKIQQNFYSSAKEKNGGSKPRSRHLIPDRNDIRQYEKQVACENIRFSSLFVAGDGETDVFAG